MAPKEFVSKLADNLNQLTQMNGDEHPHMDAGGESSSQQDSSNANTDSHSANKEFEDLKDAVKQAWGDGASKARAAAEESVPKAKSAVEKAAYEFVYEIAYGTSFASAVVSQVVPDILKRATTSGSEAGRQAAEDFQKNRGSDFEQDTQPPDGGAGAEPA